MSWDYSTGFQLAIMDGSPTTDEWVAATTISLSTTTITDSGSGFGNFAAGDWIRVLSPLNKNVYAQLISATAGSLVCAAATFTEETNGAAAVLVVEKVAPCSYAGIFQNGFLDIYTGGAPASADAAEIGVKLARLTLGSGSFTTGISANGLNFGEFTSGYLGRAIDPNTGVTEVWSGVGLAAGTAGWGRFYANAGVTGISTTAVRKDGTITTVTGGDIVMAAGRTVAVGAPVAVTSVAINASGV